MRKRLVFPVVLAVVVGVPSALQAQDGFMFGAPEGQLTVRAGSMMHMAGGDLMGFMRDELTLSRGSFRAPSIQADLGIRLNSSFDVVVGIGYASVTSPSEFRDWVEEDDSPIAQTTRLRVLPFTASVRYYPMSRGREISELAWVPARTTPYVGAGFGVSRYQLRQDGDFLDFQDLTIFTSTLETAGWTAVGQAFAGVDYWFATRVGANLEARYVYGGAQPNGGFGQYDRLDLSGIQLGLGLNLRW